MNKKLFAAVSLLFILGLAGCNAKVETYDTTPKPMKDVETEADKSVEEAVRIGKERFQAIKTLDDYCALLPVSDVEQITGKKISQTKLDFGCTYSESTMLLGEPFDSPVVILTPEQGTVQQAMDALKGSEAEVNKQTKEKTGMSLDISWTFTPELQVSSDAVYGEGLVKLLKWSNKNHPGHFSLMAPEGTYVPLAQIVNKNLGE